MGWKEFDWGKFGKALGDNLVPEWGGSLFEELTGGKKRASILCPAEREQLKKGPVTPERIAREAAVSASEFWSTYAKITGIPGVGYGIGVLGVGRTIGAAPQIAHTIQNPGEDPEATTNLLVNAAGMAIVGGGRGGQPEEPVGQPDTSMPQDLRPDLPPAGTKAMTQGGDAGRAAAQEVGEPPTSRGPRPQLPSSVPPPKAKPGPVPQPKGRGLASAQAAAGGHAPGLSPTLAELALKIDALLRSKGIGGSRQYPQALAIKQVGDGYVVSLSGDPAMVQGIQNSVQLPQGFDWGNAVGDTSGFQNPYDGGPLSDTCAEPRLPRGADGGDPAVLWRGNSPNKYPYPGNPQFMLPCPSCGTNWGTMFGSL